MDVDLAGGGSECSRTGLTTVFPSVRGTTPLIDLVDPDIVLTLTTSGYVNVESLETQGQGLQSNSISNSTNFYLMKVGDKETNTLKMNSSN